MVRRSKANPKKQVDVSLDTQDIEGLQKISEETGRSMSGIIREAVKRYLREHR